LTSTLPAISAARPIAPLGSTTSFSSRKAKATAAVTSASLAVTPLPISRRLIGKVSSPGVGTIRASQMVPLVRGFLSRRPLWNERSVSSKPSGSTV
jgi:hypothetical protein